MPTTRARHVVTESDELRSALDRAARRWPDVSRAQLVVRLALAGDESARLDDEDRAVRRRSALQRHRGALRGVYGEDYLERLRDDWPE